jgi:hypothetical protein
MLDPAFDKDVTAYTLVLPYGAIAHPFIGATAEDPTAKIVAEQPNDIPGNAKFTVTSQSGLNKIYTVVVKADIKPFSRSLNLVANTNVTFQCRVIAKEGDHGIGYDTFLQTGGEQVYLENPSVLPIVISNTSVTVTGIYLGSQTVSVGGQNITMKKVRVTSIA